MRKKGSRSLEGYLNALAAKKPVPGGGSAAAYAGALGLALSSMACEYSLDKPAGEIGAAMKRFLRENKKDMRALLKAMVKDEVSYLNLSDAVKRGSPSRALYKKAAEVPLEVTRVIESAALRARKLMPLCSSRIISDLVESLFLMEAAYKCARLNVEANLKYIKDRLYVKDVEKRLDKAEGIIKKAVKSSGV